MIACRSTQNHHTYNPTQTLYVIYSYYPNSPIYDRSCNKRKSKLKNQIAQPANQENQSEILCRNATCECASMTCSLHQIERKRLRCVHNWRNWLFGTELAWDRPKWPTGQYEEYCPLPFSFRFGKSEVDRQRLPYTGTTDMRIVKSCCVYLPVKYNRGVYVLALETRLSTSGHLSCERRKFRRMHSLPSSS